MRLFYGIQSWGFILWGKPRAEEILLQPQSELKHKCTEALGICDFFPNSPLSLPCKTKHAGAMSERACRINTGVAGTQIRGVLEAAGTLRWNVNNWGYLLPQFDMEKPPCNKVDDSTFKFLQKPHAKGRIVYALKLALKTSCWTEMFCRVGGCGKHRAMCEPALGIWKKESVFQWFLNFCTAKVSVSRRLSRADPLSHYPYLFCKPNKKGTLDVQGKKSCSSLKSVKNAQKRQGINGGGGGGRDGQGERKLLELWFRGFPWAVDNSSGSLQCLVCTPSTANCSDFEDLNTGEQSVPPCTPTTTSLYLLLINMTEYSFSVQTTVLSWFIGFPAQRRINVPRNKHNKDFPFWLGRHWWPFC